MQADQYLFMVFVDVAVSELLPAQLTLVWFIFTVDDLMSSGLIQTLKAPAADITGVRTLFYRHKHNATPTSCSAHVLFVYYLYACECLLFTRM